MSARREVPAWKAKSALLTFAMGISIYWAPTLGILATSVIADLDLSRGLFGLLLAGSGLSAACLSPLTGAVLDRVGAWRGLLALFTVAFLSALVLALATNVATLVLASLLAGMASALANPATNQIIARELDGAPRGAIVGLKQSGVQVAIAGLGVLLPPFVALWSWRAAVLTVGSIALIGIPWTLGVRGPGDVKPREEKSSAYGHPSARIAPGLTSLTTYAAAMGIVTGAVIGFLPLYAQEGLQFSEIQAGRLATVVGSIGIVARIGWSMAADRQKDLHSTLAAIAVVAILASWAIVVSTPQRAYIIWVGAALAGASSSAWNPVAMLAAMRLGGAAMASRATGVVVAGFLAGFAASPMAFGWLIEATDGYVVAWSTVATFAALAAGVAALGHRRSLRQRSLTGDA